MVITLIVVFLASFATLTTMILLNAFEPTRRYHTAIANLGGFLVATLLYSLGALTVVSFYEP